MRLFIGIKTGCEGYLSSLQAEVRKAGNGSFTETEKLHITLRFLGEVLPPRVEDICSALAETGGHVFSLECRGIEVFKRGRIVSAKVGGELKKLSAFHKRLESALEKRGFERPEREWCPHITLARNFQAFGKYSFNEVFEAGCVFAVQEVILFESRQNAGRSEYIPLYVHRLDQPDS